MAPERSILSFSRIILATAYMEAACFAPIRLGAQAVSAFKDEKKAAQYGLP